MDKTKIVFGNVISQAIVKKAERTKHKYLKKFGDDSDVSYTLSTSINKTLGPVMGVQNVVIGEPDDRGFDVDRAIIIGNIRMGFGHYRISMAVASAARSMGYTPYWFDLHSFKETTGGKVIEHLNGLYSMGSRWSQKYPLFNRLYWEPLNSEGFKKLDYNAVDQKMAELMTPIYRQLPKHIPFIATHAWPAQAAVHAGMERVVNVIPDNWPMALHLSEGAIHTVQTPSAYIGYKTLNGMAGDSILKPMPDEAIHYVGHYIDHELVVNLEADCEKRIERIKKNQVKRLLLTVGGAGAQQEIFGAVIRHVLPLVKAGKVALYINVGDYRNVWQALCLMLPELVSTSTVYFDDWEKTCQFTETALLEDVCGIHVFSHSDIFQAVYSTNLLMRSTDLMITKPSELAFYPVPKLLIKRVGGHEAWGAVHAAEIGDGTIECETEGQTLQMLDVMLSSPKMLSQMNQCILSAHSAGVYKGAYKAVALAVTLWESIDEVSPVLEI